MNDLEALLRGLTEDDGPPVAPPVTFRSGTELATGALNRARTRRRRRGTLIGVAAALSVVTVVVGVDARVLGGVDAGGARGISLPARAGSDDWPRPRENVLLLGANDDPHRVGVRSDTFVVASIDTRSGDTLLVSLPRNLQHVPFPSGSKGAQLFPDGFSCSNPAGINTECLLNALWTWGDAHPEYYPDDPHPGRTATVQAVEQVTGLTVDEVVVVSLRGFTSLVDAVGGVDVTVTGRLPIGGSPEHPAATEWLVPGRRHLDGYHALWFARSRWSSDDYDRMRRQRCLASALARQVDAGDLTTRLPHLLAAMKNDVTMSIGLRDLPRWAALAGKVRTARLRTLVLDNTVINTVRPDVPAIRRLIADALDGGSAPVTNGSGSPGAPGSTPAGPPTAAAPSAGAGPSADGVVHDAEVVCRE